MYYVSRRYSTSKFGVIDTDDGVEDTFTIKELQELVCEKGIEIKGVETYTKCTSHGQTMRIRGIQVYQPEENVNVSQVKLHVITGVDIKTQGTEIVSVTWRSLSERKPCSVRLSTFGSSCADYLFSDISEYKFGVGSFLTLILDDKITVSGKSFKRCATVGIIMDLREVTNNRTAECVYKELVGERYMGVYLLSERVKDIPERLDYWRAVCLLNRGYRPSDIEKPASVILNNPDVVLPQIEKKFTKEFKALLGASLGISQRGSISSMVKQYILWLVEPHQMDLIVCYDYDTLRSRCLDSLFRVLGWGTNCNASVIERYQNYIKYFPVSEEMKSSFVDFCHKANNFLLRYGEREGYIIARGHQYVVRK